jgi:hypothetical protein
MNKISITYKPVDVAQKIIDNQGDCTNLNMCGACPFFNQCFDSIRDKSRFLDRETRLRNAEEFVFSLALECEIG